MESLESPLKKRTLYTLFDGQSRTSHISFLIVPASLLNVMIKSIYLTVFDIRICNLILGNHVSLPLI